MDGNSDSNKSENWYRSTYYKNHAMNLTYAEFTKVSTTTLQNEYETNETFWNGTFIWFKLRDIYSGNYEDDVAIVNCNSIWNSQRIDPLHHEKWLSFGFMVNGTKTSLFDIIRRITRDSTCS